MIWWTSWFDGHNMALQPSQPTDWRTEQPPDPRAGLTWPVKNLTFSNFISGDIDKREDLWLCPSNKSLLIPLLSRRTPQLMHFHRMTMGISGQKLIRRISTWESDRHFVNTAKIVQVVPSLRFKLETLKRGTMDQGTCNQIFTSK